MKKFILIFLVALLLFCSCAAPNTESVPSGNSSTPSSKDISSLPLVTAVPSSVTSTVSQEPSALSTVSEDIGELMTQAEFDDFIENALPEVVTLISGRQACDSTDYTTDNDIIYYKVTDEKYNTVDNLKAEFAKYFTSEYIDKYFNSFFESGKPYKEKDGIIYTHVDSIIATYEVVLKNFHFSKYNDDFTEIFNLGADSFGFDFLMRCIDGKWKIDFAMYGIASNTSTPTPAWKPVIYLYPEVVTDVKVKLDLNGKLGCTYPAYPKDGWKVTAYPNGQLIVSGEEYNYLFWEGELNTVYTFDKGFCVKGRDTVPFLKKALSEMGLIPSEYNDFIVYWLPQMEKNAFNLISFADVDYTENAKLEITPKPDSTLRVFMIFKPLKKAITIAPQTFEKFERNGFTVVEWGGAEID